MNRQVTPSDLDDPTDELRLPEDAAACEVVHLGVRQPPLGLGRWQARASVSPGRRERLIARVAITGGAIALIVLRHCCPRLQIDAATLILFGVAALPWLASVIRSVEVPGAGKIELQDVKEATERVIGPVETPTASRATVSPPNRPTINAAIIQALGESARNPTYVVGRLAYEIEGRIKTLAARHGLFRGEPGFHPMQTQDLIHKLERAGHLTSDMARGLSDMVGIGGRAGKMGVDPNAAVWVAFVGPELIRRLDEVIDSSGPPRT